jgi:hypothetical protein
MARVHRDVREGMCSRFTHESKFWTENSSASVQAVKALSEGDRLRKMLTGRRILLDLRQRDLKNAFRL